MATNTYVALNKVTVSTATPSITFSSIPQGYTDLVVVAGNVTVSNDGYTLDFKINGDTGSNYSLTNISGNGSAYRSDRVSNGTNTSNDLSYYYGFSSSSPGSSVLNFMDYSNTARYKTVLARTGASTKEVEASVHLWRNTAAITSIEIAAAGTNIAAGSTFSLYGIAAASVGAKATGGTVYSDANYYYHVFGASGTFTPTQSISADALVIAGGGGDVGRFGGGGGAGGLVYSPSQSLTATAYTVTVGAGGVGNANGSNSNITGGSLSLTAAVGGGRGGNLGVNGSSGGSGGGGGGNDSGGPQTGGAGTAGQGFAGGSGLTWNGSSGRTGGGGGGAGGIGGSANNTTRNAGAGGVGSSTYSSWGIATGTGQNVSGTYYYAGGGGGGSYQYNGEGVAGAGGYGGGGAGLTGIGSGANGTANTGGGAGGSGEGASPSNGGSGIVIVRYAKV